MTAQPKSKAANNPQKPRARRSKKPALVLHYEEHQQPLSGVGPGVGKAFVQACFPQATHTIRVASAYFQLTGHKIARPYINPGVQLHLLVGKEEGENVRSAVIDEIRADLGQCTTDVWSAVYDLVERIRQGRFFIRDARAMQPPFHAKFYVCDEACLWHGSTNYTKRGLTIAAEQASLIRDPAQIRLFIDWYDTVAQNAEDLLAALLEKLEAWLKLASPFDVYLKTLLLLGNMPPYDVYGDAHMPTYFQKGVIAQALRQIETCGGALIVAATGLGKTVIGADIALRLVKQGTVENILLLAPQSVHGNWEQECDGRNINPKMFDITVPFRLSSGQSTHQIYRLEQQLKRAGPNTLIIIDEAHFYRNQLLADHTKAHKSQVYRRFLAAVKAGAKIVLLTATAYGTNLQNLNSLLHLLPHTKPMMAIRGPWSADDPTTFTALPVVSILGLPHVIRMARERGDVDGNGRVFVQIVGGKQYLPGRIVLCAPRYQLCLQPEIQKAFDENYFAQERLFAQWRYDDDTRKFQLSLVDTIYSNSLRSWLSSPADFHASIRKNIATPNAVEPDTMQLALPLPWDGPPQIDSQDDLEAGDSSDRPYKVSLQLAHQKRITGLEPLLHQLAQLSTDDDDKFLHLKDIVEQHCIHENNKVLVFVERLYTARYVAEGLQRLFSDRLRIGCTVDPGRLQPQLKNVRQRAEILKQFSPRSQRYAPAQEYDILVCTDADGIGVNLQDANVVVHYDPPDGADALFQRVGRILRMTEDPDRVLHIYSLVPTLIDTKLTTSRVHQAVNEIFGRLSRRHDTSQRILGASILSNNERSEITLETDVEILRFASEGDLLEDVGGLGVESRLRHTAVLEQYYERAVKIPDYILSARTSPKQQSQMFVLVQHAGKLHPVVYNLVQQTLEPLQDFEVLDLIACTEAEQLAPISAAAVENFANQAVQAWCKHERVDPDEARKICAMCLVQQDKAGEIANLFQDVSRLKI